MPLLRVRITEHRTERYQHTEPSELHTRRLAFYSDRGPGAVSTSGMTVAGSNGFNGSVSLTASGLPTAVTASFSPNPATGSSVLTVTASSTAATGTTA